VQDREVGKHDPGAIKFLQQLINTMSSHAAGTILTLCDFWQSHAGAPHGRLSRSSALRFAAEKAARRIKDVSSSHNLAPPLFSAAYGNLATDDYSWQPTKGFHHYEPMQEPKEKQGICPMPVNSEMGDESTSLRLDNRPLQLYQAGAILLSEEAGNNSEDSFGAAGDWGDDSDDDLGTTLKGAYDDALAARGSNFGEPML
jgi:hypothetical protein